MPEHLKLDHRPNDRHIFVQATHARQIIRVTPSPKRPMLPSKAEHDDRA
jgi:hypothetical protein